MRTLRKYGESLLHLFFPRVCIICLHPLILGEKTVCSRCVSQLEPSRHIDFKDNDIVYIFEGLVPIHLATAGFQYHKAGLLQQLIFQLKYHYHKEIGYVLGKIMGETLRNTDFKTVDYIIPVPLHPKKQRKRGYNQSEWIAKGIGEALGKKVRTDVLKRRVNTASQTKKNRMQRYENVQNVFVVRSKISARKHILLVDDIVTTGSTLHACAEALLKETDNLQISIACLAKAN